MNAPTSPAGPTRSIGAILVDAGRLRLEDAERIMRLQREKGLRFGDAAKELGLLKDADVAFALARQFDYPYVLRGKSLMSDEIIAAYTPFTPAVESLRALRSQLMLRWFAGEVERKALAIVSTERGEGRSWLAANLAVVCSQLGERTLLIDADLRNSRQHQLFGLDNRAGLSAILSGRGGLESVQRIPGLLSLSVLPAGAMPPNPQELLARMQFNQLLGQVAGSFDVIIIDTPATSDTADAQMLAMRAGGALIVARKNLSRASRLRDCAESLTQVGVALVGSVLNEH